MKPVEFTLQTTVLAPPDNNPDLGNGSLCGGLPVRRYEDRFCSYWKPTGQDLENLLAGGHVELTVFGRGHPPVWLATAPKGTVEELP